MMKNYVGCKIVDAMPSTYGDYFKEKYKKEYEDTNGYHLKCDSPGYTVIYPPIGINEKPHMSWSPKDIFEKCYRELHPAEKESIYVAMQDELRQKEI